MNDVTPASALVAASETTEEGPRRPLRIYTPVISEKAIMDTARFEHLGRVATVMARAGLMPVSLTCEKNGEDLAPLPFEVVQARAIMIANQAELWGADPISVAQCTSIVHGKLMYEGKLVHAVISANLGIDLLYEFGTFNAAKRDIDGEYVGEGDERRWVGKMPASPDDQGLGVRVSGTLPGEKQARWTAGSVAMWHTGNKGPWFKSSAWPRQLRYMGAREWCRAYKPSLLLGIISEDEAMDDFFTRDVAAVGAATPQLPHSGFVDERKGELIEGPKPSRRRKAQAEPEPTPEPVQEVVSEGHAGVGEVYLLAGEEPNAEGLRLAYKDGERFSAVATDHTEVFKTYAAHSPLVPEVEETVEGQVVDESESQDDADEEEVTGEEAEGEEEDDDDDGLPPEFKQYIGRVEKAPTFAEVKKAMADFYKTEFFKALSAGQQNKIRAQTWEQAVDNKLPDLPDQAQDVSAFRLWLETCEDAEAIHGTLSVLERAPAFDAKDPSFKDAIRKAVAVRVEALKAA